MKSDAVTAVGVALIDLPLTVEPHPLFGIRRTEMESRAGAPLACLAVAEVNPIRLTCGNYSKRAAVALPGSFHQPLPGYPSLSNRLSASGTPQGRLVGASRECGDYRS